MILIFGDGQLGKTLSVILGSKGILIPKSACDISNLAQLSLTLSRFRGKISGVVNCAAFTNVDLAEIEAGKNWLANTYGPAILSHSLKSIAPNAFGVHVSTDFVFGKFAGGPHFADDLPLPVNAYGEAKWMGEVAWMSQQNRAVVRVQNLGTDKSGIIGKFNEMGLAGQTANIARGAVCKPTSCIAAGYAILEASKHLGQIHHYGPVDVCTVEAFWTYVSKGLAYHLMEPPHRPAQRNYGAWLENSEWPESLRLTWKQHVDLALGRMELRND